MNATSCHGRGRERASTARVHLMRIGALSLTFSERDANPTRRPTPNPNPNPHPRPNPRPNPTLCCTRPYPSTSSE